MRLTDTDAIGGVLDPTRDEAGHTPRRVKYAMDEACSASDLHAYCGLPL